jgi:transglutaminase-like putative cysteine protease
LEPNGGGRKPVSEQRRGESAWAAPVATIAITLVSITAAVAMCRVFADWEFLAPMIALVIMVHAAAWLLRLLRLSGWIAVPLGALAVATLVGIVYYADTTTLGIPSFATLDAFLSDLRLVWQQFPTAVAPVPSRGNFAVVGGTVLALCAFFADTFAFRAMGRAEAVVPTGVTVVFIAALGADRNRITVTALWLAMALVAVVALRHEHRSDGGAWMGPRPQRAVGTLAAGVLCAGCVSVGAAALGPRLPGAGEPALLDTRNRTGEVTQVISPLVDIRSSLVNRSNSLFFTVYSEQSHYWRLISLSVFDGRQWRPADQDLVEAGGNLTAPHPQAEVVNYSVEIGRMRGKLVPSAYSPVSIEGSIGVGWAPGNETLVADDELERGNVFNFQSSILRPSADQLRTATTSSAPDERSLELPDGLPGEVRDLATEVTAGAATPYDQALLLQNWFQSEFQYSLQVQRGHSNDAISDFLENRIGYCEQFAGTFSAMARSLGLPARVVVGFTSGERQANGGFAVYGRQAHAWSEVWFDGFGWMPFEPTPGRGSPDAQDHTGLAPAQQEGTVGTPGVNAGAPIDENPPTPTVRPGGGPPTTLNAAAPTTAPLRAASGGDGSSSPVVWIFLTAIALAVAWLAFGPRLIARRHRRHETPEQRIVSGWRRTISRFERLGVRTANSATPSEYADYVLQHAFVDTTAMTQLASMVTNATYSQHDPDEADAEQAEHLEDIIADAYTASASRRQRLTDRALLRN